MEAPTIDNMTDDFLFQVFAQLDKASLLNSALVCKRWNEEISNSTKLMGQFTLQVIKPYSPYSLKSENLWNQSVEKALQVNRKVINVTFRNDNDQSDVAGILKVVEAHSCVLRTISFEWLQIDAQSLARALSAIKNLESVTLEFCKVTPGEEDFKVQKMINLKTFKTNCLDGAITKVLSGATLSSLEIKRMNSSVNGHQYMLFLQTQRSLETIKVFTFIPFEAIQSTLSLESLRKLSVSFSGIHYNINVTPTGRHFELRAYCTYMHELAEQGEINYLSNGYLLRLLQSTPAFSSISTINNVPKEMFFAIENFQKETRKLELIGRHAFGTYDLFRVFKDVEMPKLREFTFKSSDCGFIREFIEKNSIERIFIKNFRLENFSWRSLMTSLIKSSITHITVEGSFEPIMEFMVIAKTAAWTKVVTIQLNVNERDWRISPFVFRVGSSKNA